MLTGAVCAVARYLLRRDGLTGTADLEDDELMCASAGRKYLEEAVTVLKIVSVEANKMVAAQANMPNGGAQ